MKPIALLLPTLALAGGCSIFYPETTNVGSLTPAQLAAIPWPLIPDKADGPWPVAETFPIALVRVADGSPEVVPVDLDEGPYQYEVVLESTLPAKNWPSGSGYLIAEKAEDSICLRDARGSKIRFVRRSTPWNPPEVNVCSRFTAPESRLFLDGTAANGPVISRDEWRRYRYALPIATSRRLTEPVVVQVLPTISIHADHHAALGGPVPILSRADLPPPAAPHPTRPGGPSLLRPTPAAPAERSATPPRATPAPRATGGGRPPPPGVRWTGSSSPRRSNAARRRNASGAPPS